MSGNYSKGSRNRNQDKSIKSQAPQFNLRSEWLQPLSSVIKGFVFLSRQAACGLYFFVILMLSGVGWSPVFPCLDPPRSLLTSIGLMSRTPASSAMSPRELLEPTGFVPTTAGCWSGGGNHFPGNVVTGVERLSSGGKLLTNRGYQKMERLDGEAMGLVREAVDVTHEGKESF